MAYERMVDWFLKANHDHIAAYTMENRGRTSVQLDKDLVLLEALSYEVDNFLGALPAEFQTGELRARLICEFLQQIPEGSYRH